MFAEVAVENDFVVDSSRASSDKTSLVSFEDNVSWRYSENLETSGLCFSRDAVVVGDD